MKNLQKTDKTYWMERAFEASDRSLCMRGESRMGAVAVKNGKLLAFGFNGVVGKIQHCGDRGFCIRKKLNVPSGSQREIAFCICAEQRMICNAARKGVSLCGADVYITHYPCAYCVRLMIESGIARVYYSQDYCQQFTKTVCEESGFELVKF